MPHPFLSGIIAAALFCAPANATVRITFDGGGFIQPNTSKWEQVRRSGQRVIVDGPCISSCTLLLQIVPMERICVTRRAAFGFHLVELVAPGRPTLVDVHGTRNLVKRYPPAFRKWIAAHGPLQSAPVYMRGGDLRGVVKAC